jgi:hypothetical protein
MGILNAGLEGLRQAEAKLEKVSSRLAQMPVGLTGEPQDVVDISAEAVAMLVAKNSFEANLKSLEAAQELAKSTLDIVG